ncbi:MAG TPA: CHAP domain-containing protein [Actinocrinis sp.]|jgi:hypothetical protein
MLSAVVVAVPTASAWASASPVASQLVAAYAAARDIPSADVAGIAAGSLEQASVGATQWAVADFLPAAGDPAAVVNGFQDNANLVAFTSTGNGAWQLAAAGGFFACPGVLPAAAQQALKLTDTAVCTTVGGTPTAVPSSVVNAAEPIGTKISTIAKDNIGVQDTPATQNFNDDCNPFTALLKIPVSSAGCGRDPISKVLDRNELWCADFAKWVWKTAGVKSDLGTLTAAASSFYAWGQQHHEKMNKNGSSFAVGDAVVFYSASEVAGKTGADHVGLIVGVSKGKVYLVNGDWGGGKSISVKGTGYVNLKTWTANNFPRGEKWYLVNPTGK